MTQHKLGLLREGQKTLFLASGGELFCEITRNVHANRFDKGITDYVIEEGEPGMPKSWTSAG